MGVDEGDLEAKATLRPVPAPCSKGFWDVDSALRLLSPVRTWEGTGEQWAWLCW